MLERSVNEVPAEGCTLTLSVVGQQSIYQSQNGVSFGLELVLREGMCVLQYAVTVSMSNNSNRGGSLTSS